jgi:nicotinate dehydrogenase subunit A
MTLKQDDALSITVNGRRHEIVADPATPLLYVLRNDLGLNATKYGCGIGRCGACTVLIDGRPERSCLYPAGDTVGRSVTTLEGLGSAEALHPLQQAFLDEQAMQCGYCIAGIVMTAAALLHEHKQPDEATIKEALAENLCRCGAHVRIVRAVLRAAKAANAS